MNIKIINQKDKKAEFLVEGISFHYANTLRRAMIDLVPTLSIEFVEFRVNTSAMYDEILAHRLGLIPLVTDSTYEYKEERVEGDPLTEVTLTLEAKGPCVVYSGDIKCKDPKVKPVFPKIPIVELLEGQELVFQATAITGIGKLHTKWCPGLVWFNYAPSIKVNNSKLEENKSKYPQSIFDSKGKISEKKIAELNLYDAVDGVSEAVKVDYDKNKIIFHIESWGQLSCNDIVHKAIEQLDIRYNEIKKLAKEI